MTSSKPNRTKTLILAGAMSGAAMLGGGAAMVLFQPASAQTTSTTTADSSGTATTTAPASGTPAAPPAGAGHGDLSKGGHVGTNGVKEELLTGDTADQVKAAALAAVPGGTVERVENDAEGATYEAHMTKADGSEVTVKLDASFAVTSTEAGHR